jgi:hypothetical protein
MIHRWIDVAAVVILSLATLLTAWSGYQASLWDGEQSSKYSQASARRIEASRAASRADQLSAIDVTVFANYLNAFATGQQDLASFYEERFRSEFKPAFDAWMATNPMTSTDAPSSPFAMPEYHLADRDRADQLETEASTLFDEGEKANERSDAYVLITVIFASVLFFAGISTGIRWHPTRIGVIGVGLALFLYGVVRLAMMPIQ